MKKTLLSSFIIAASLGLAACDSAEDKQQAAKDSLSDAATSVKQAANEIGRASCRERV